MLSFKAIHDGWPEEERKDDAEGGPDADADEQIDEPQPHDGNSMKEKVHRLGLEPRTYGLKGHCSTIELTVRCGSLFLNHPPQQTTKQWGVAVPYFPTMSCVSL